MTVPPPARSRPAYPTLTIDSDMQVITQERETENDNHLPPPMPAAWLPTWISSGGKRFRLTENPTVRSRVPVSDELAYMSELRFELACRRCDRMGVWPLTRFLHRVVKRYDTNTWAVENVIAIAAYLTKARFLNSFAAFWRWTGKDTRAWEGTYLTWRAILPPPRYKPRRHHTIEVNRP